MAKILTFNFYLDQVRLCDQYYNNKSDKLIPESGYLFKRKACYNPLFFEELNEVIKNKRPNIIILTTQNEDQESNFHSDFLPKYIKNYRLLTFKQSDNINLSIYTDDNDYTLLKIDESYINLLALYFSSPYGVFLVIVANVEDNVRFNQTRLNFIKELQSIYNANGVDYAFFLLHLPKEHNTVTVLSPHNDIELVEGYDIESHFRHLGKVDLFKQIVKRKVLCFSWNADKVPLCGNLGNVKFGKRNNCYNPLFFEKVNNYIREYDPNILVFSTEGDVEKGTWFHAEFLRRQMNYLGYQLLTNDKLINLRLSIYVRPNQFSLFHPNRQFFFNNEDYVEDVAVVKGSSIHSTVKSMVKYVKSGNDTIAFLTLDIPDDIENTNDVNVYLTKMLQTLVKKVDHVFILGHFNMPTHSIDNDLTLEEVIQLYEFEEYSALEEYDEKIDYPTYQLQSHDYRQPFTFDQSRYKRIGWHNRIYYRNATPLLYKTIYGYPMLIDNSEHLGVLGVYQF